MSHGGLRDLLPAGQVGRRAPLGRHISDPEKNPDRVLLVSMTSYDVGKEDVCLIDVGEHPRVKHKTRISYKPARQTSLEDLDRLRDSQYLRMQEPVSPEILHRIRRGASLSRRIDLEHLELMEEQELLD